MFEAEEDGAITEMELAVILKTALGVTHLSVSRLFTAIDPEDTGKITFGKRCNSTITGHNTFLLILVFNVALLLFFFFFMVSSIFCNQACLILNVIPSLGFI